MRVLVVDDERRLAAALRRGLSAEGFDVELAHDGISGQELAERGGFDIIVLDIMLPRRNGYDVCAALRRQGIGTPILMLTAKDGEYDEAEALDTGADDYLTKPFHFVVLVARLRALLRRAAAPAQGSQAPAAGATLTVGDLRIVPDQHRCLRGDDEIALTAREFGILAYLARRPGVVVGKAELIDELWDFASPADQNVVEVHISSLRRKVDAPFGRRTIETVRGVGYRLNPDEGE
ncbi:DNA-binding response regulator, OmpR family, contains REC and winged-helix (wHTH) domain [Tessaracoccus bendigoensis DSM 12906]|uniref:DNA-binding response regulator, OmpR family, contains REC and winged-helix (WHTH) domain n=1 Tax=Tessaracoccus bendigoensis DSM 12906 TaxID=1123357 RepID=A0A1M6E267_9ACTN|nr:response regulator transcription factor [Tessaracoccus bendigoensis]SHI79499.1 DNA-binding response regulator, OmpR family, contains REC and winged-helix (wHTH) domain [Tessaracoccus bendigoensis DSM 12906]